MCASYCNGMVYKCALHCRNVHEDEINGDGDDDNKEDIDNGEDDVILILMIVCE